MLRAQENEPGTGSLSRGRRGCAEQGFTLLELMVVIVVIAMAAAVVIPRLPMPQSTRLKTSAHDLASAIRFLNDQAIITKGSYRLHLNIGENAIKIGKVGATGEEGPPDDQFMNRSILQEAVGIDDVVVPSQGGLHSEGEVVLAFGPGGNADCITIHLKGGEEHYTIVAYPSGGKVKVFEGYQEAAL